LSWANQLLIGPVSCSAQEERFC